MATKKLIKKKAFTPEKGTFYFVKNGDIYGVKPNRSGGKKGRKVCKPSAKKTTAKKTTVKKRTVKKRTVKRRK